MENIKRRNYFIDKSFQAKFIIKFCMIVTISSLLIGALLFFLSRHLTTVAIENAQVIVKSTSDFMLPIIIETILLVTIFAALAVIALTLFASHKIAGPLYRLKREIDLFKNGDLKANFTTRKSDQLQDLAGSLFDMGKVFNNRHSELKGKLIEVKRSLEDSQSDKQAILKKLGELEQALNYFKI